MCHSDTKVWYHSPQSSTSPPLLSPSLRWQPSSFSGLGVDTVSEYGRSHREDGLAPGPPDISSPANPDGSETCSDSARPCQDQLVPGFWHWQKPSLVLLWDGAHRCIPRRCFAPPDVPKGNNKSCKRQTSEASEKPKGGFFWLRAHSKAGL